MVQQQGPALQSQCSVAWACLGSTHMWHMSVPMPEHLRRVNGSHEPRVQPLTHTGGARKAATLFGSEYVSLPVLKYRWGRPSGNSFQPQYEAIPRLRLWARKRLTSPALPSSRCSLHTLPSGNAVGNLQPDLSPNFSPISFPSFPRPCPLSDLAWP